MFSRPADATLELLNTETVSTGAGVKSVIISADGSMVYSANLEGMSVYEFQRDTRKLIRKLALVPHPGKGYNYTTKETIDSYQEKPVEQHFTHGGRYLWVSLHNAGGVVVWDLLNGDTFVEGMPYKDAYIKHADPSVPTQKVKLLLVETGVTPKVITSSPDGKYLFVSNWHSDTVSVIDIQSSESNEWKKIRDLKARIPRGLVVSADSRTLYIAEMGTEIISIVNLETFEKNGTIHVGLNPRHLLLDKDELFVSLNLGSQLAKVDLSEKLSQKTATCNLPRTIAIPQDSRMVFSVCYKGDMLQAFSADDLSLLGSWDSGPRPVGLDVFWNETGQIEVWVANYTASTITVFTFSVEEPDSKTQALLAE